MKLLPLYDSLGAPYEVMDGAEMRARWPELRPSCDAIGLHDPQGGFSEPDDYIKAVAEQLNKMGVSVRQGVTVRDFCVEGGRVTGIRTDSETIRSDAVICAVHCWSLPLLKSIQLHHPVKNFVHQRYLSAPLPKPWEGPAVNADPYWGYVRPARGGRLLLGLETQERLEWPVHSPKFEMHEVTDPPEALLREGVHRFESLLPLVSNCTWTEQKVGLISFSMDGEPVLGPVVERLPGTLSCKRLSLGRLQLQHCRWILPRRMAGRRATIPGSECVLT